MKAERSRTLYAEAARVLVGGVNSPVRAFMAVGGTPRVIRKAEDAQVDVQLTRVGSMLGLFFNNEPVIDYREVKSSDTSAYKAWFNLMLEQGVYLPPSPFETMFVSAAHTRRDIDRTVQAAAVAFQRIVKRRSVETGIARSIH